MTTIKEQIEELKSFLTGDLFEDGDILQKIYELKKELYALPAGPSFW